MVTMKKRPRTTYASLGTIGALIEWSRRQPTPDANQHDIHLRSAVAPHSDRLFPWEDWSADRWHDALNLAITVNSIPRLVIEFGGRLPPNPTGPIWTPGLAEAAARMGVGKALHKWGRHAFFKA